MCCLAAEHSRPEAGPSRERPDRTLSPPGVFRGCEEGRVPPPARARGRSGLAPRGPRGGAGSQGAPHATLRLARRLLRHRLPAHRAGRRRNTRNGFAFQLPGLARSRGYNFKLVNFGCGGATTTSILQAKGECRAPAARRAVYTNKTQTAAAEAFLRANRGQVGLITVSIGGNDVTKCVSEADPTTCVAEAGQGDQDQRQGARQATARGGRPQRSHRRHHVPRRRPRACGSPGSSPTRISQSSPCPPSAGSSTRRSRIPTPRSGGAASSTSRPPPARIRRSSRRPRWRRTARSRSPSPRSASSATTASSATSTHGRAATRSSPS